jgi:hypothetical protein
MRNSGWENYDSDRDEQWAVLREGFSRFGVEVPANHMAGGFRIAISSVMSAKLGRPIGFQFRKLVEIAHYLAEQNRGFLHAFGWALKVYDTRRVIESEDASGRWQSKELHIRSAMTRRDPAYEPNRTCSAVLQFLFPELANRMQLRINAEAPA